MSRRRTILERILPNVPEFTCLANNWKPDALSELFDYFWRGCDAIVNDIIKPACGALQDDISLERSLNSKLAPRVQRSMPIECPFYFQHKPDEFESLDSPSAQPPEPDFAFVSYKNERCMLPIEAKVLPTDGQVSKYIDEVHNNFLTYKYGPFSNEGAMLGYLLTGKPRTAFANINRKLNYSVSLSKVPQKSMCKLSHHPNFKQRNHKISNHVRKRVPENNYDNSFCCHHMILEIGHSAIT